MKRSALLLAATLLGVLAVPPAGARQPAPTPNYAVGAQYDTTHVYVAPGDFDAFVASLLATFGGKATKEGVFQVTPTPSQTMSQLVMTPVGTFSVFGFKTPVPYPFGAERTGYLVSNMDKAVSAAVASGATRLVTTFPDPIGRDAVIQWPGGVNMQIYWHTTKPDYAALAHVPENRVYLTADAADLFVRHWLAFSHGTVASDDAKANGTEIGMPGTTYRRIDLTSGYGRMRVIVSSGQLPWPYGRDMTGYEVDDLADTLAKANQAGVETLVAPHPEAGRSSAMVRFPGGYVAEIHTVAR